MEVCQILVEGTSELKVIGRILEVLDSTLKDVSAQLLLSEQEKKQQKKRLYQSQRKDLWIYINAVEGWSNLEQVVGVTRYVKCQGSMDWPIDKNLIIFDADTIDNKGGFSKRQQQIVKVMEQSEAQCKIPWHLFLLPNNSDDGMLETLLLRALSSNATSIVPCVNGLVECFHAHNASCELKEKHKVALFAWGCCEKANKDLRFEPSLKGDATWDYTSEEFGPLRDFLKRELDIV